MEKGRVEGLHRLAGEEGLSQKCPVPERVDAVVIGGGVCGLSAAYELSKSGWDVALIEAGPSLGSGASGACGLFAPEFEGGLGEMERLAGTEGAGTILRGLSKTLAELRRRAGAEGWMDGSGVGTIAGSREEMAELMAWEEVAEVLGRGCYRALGSGPAMAQLCFSPKCAGALACDEGFHGDPSLAVRSLALSALKAGTRFWMGKPVLAIGKERVNFEGGSTIAAKAILVCAGSWGGGFEKVAQEMPCWMAASGRLPKGEAQRLFPSGAGCQTRGGGARWMRVDGQGRLLFGGRGKGFGSGRGAVEASLGEFFPDLDLTGLDLAWRESRAATTLNGFPRVAEESPGVWRAAGFGTKGLVAGAYAGAALAWAAMGRGDDLEALSRLSPKKMPGPNLLGKAALFFRG